MKSEKSMIKSRYIFMRSDCRRFTITARLVSEQNGPTNDYYGSRKVYSGSHWDIVLTQDGKRVTTIMGVHYGQYCNGICIKGMKMSKNTVLYGAVLMGCFTRELKDIDVEKVKRQWHREYAQARLKFG